MSIFSRFFGKKDDDESAASTGLVANPSLQDPLSLQVLFDGQVQWDAGRVTQALRSYHRSLAKAQAEIDPSLAAEGKIFGMVGWGKHVVRLVGFDLPMPKEPVEQCVAPAHYPQEMKERARNHASHVLLYYAGYERDRLEHYVALAAVAGALAPLGASVVLNESAHTSFPAAALARDEEGGDMIDLLRTLPLPILYCGFVKYNVEGVPGVWMRTYGAHLLGLPDFAALALGHEEGEKYFEMFDSILRYLRDSGAMMAPGHTMQIGADEFLRVRAPKSDEFFLESEGPLLVAETITSDQINR